MAINIEYKSFYNYIQLTIFTQIPVEPLFKVQDIFVSTNYTVFPQSIHAIVDIYY